MDGRKRTVQIKFRVTEAERDLILEKMKLVPTRNMAAYLRKIAIDGYVLRLDLPELKEMVSLLRRSSNNLNQIAKYFNQGGILSQEMRGEINKRLRDLYEMKYKVMEMAGDFHGNTETYSK